MEKSAKEILVIFGGVSPEYEVSCSSAASFIEGIDKGKYNVSAVGITKSGEWIYTQAPKEEIKEAYLWVTNKGNKKAILSVDRKDKGLIVFNADGSYFLQKIDLIIPLVHGENGEDGSLQGLFEIAGIPYVGSDICASSCSMDKAVTSIFADHAGLKQPESYSVSVRRYNKDKANAVKEAEEKLSAKYPMFVKPSMTGSSIGVSKVTNREELIFAMELASRYRGRIIVEEAIVGKEIKVAILGNDDLKMGALCEINIEGETFNDYNTKYKGTGSHKKIPAELDPDVEEKIYSDARAIYRALGCRGFARVDFFLTKDKELYFNEINTIPGITNKSIFSLMMDRAGLPYPEMIETLITQNLEQQ